MIDTFEFSKIAGVVLAALLVILLPRTLMEIFAPHHPEKPGYTLPMPEAAPAAAPAGGEAAGAAAAPAPAGFDANAVVALAKSANPEDGKGIFRKCVACHSFEKGAANKVGPDLWGVVGRPKGTHEGFGYSEAMKAKGGDWTYPDLANFIHNPKGWLPGTKMLFAGVAEPADVAALLAYLRTLGDNPVPLP